MPELTLGTTVANLGFSKIAFPHPVFAGATSHVVTEVGSARLSSSRPNNGIVEFRHDGFNQNETLVCQAHRAALMLRRPTEAGLPTS